MSYPQYHGGQYPYSQASTPKPKGGTAIAAGVLAAIGAVMQMLVGLMNIVLGLTQSHELRQDAGLTWYPTYVLSTGAVALLAGTLLGTGAVALFRRRPAGRLLIVAGCASAILFGIAWAVVMFGVTLIGGLSGIAGTLDGSVGLVFPIATIILALVPSTRRWIAAEPAQNAIQPPPYPGQPYPAQPTPAPWQPIPPPGHPMSGGPMNGQFVAVQPMPYPEPAQYPDQPGDR
ncbi:hypothetical protein [Nocardia vinacea]|uniref:hypothetical protein n=1 Tax=Nocardia vinacea TaxID=96468 RepID=UPI0002F1CA3F|nr:hypothetical protein [Nocardia vinacea]